MIIRPEILDSLVEAINNTLAQGGPSVNDEGQCRYRSEDGKRCVLGWMIPDTMYHSRVEGSQICFNDKLEMILADVFQGRLSHTEMEFLRKFQLVHDDASANNAWEGVYSEFLKTFEQTGFPQFASKINKPEGMV